MKNTPHPSEYQSVGPLFDNPLRPQAVFTKVDFDGITYEPVFDATRLRGEMARVYEVIKDHHWYTLGEIGLAIQHRFFGQRDSEAGISARLRDFRKTKWGSHTVNRRRRGDPKQGIFEYQLL